MRVLASVVITALLVPVVAAQEDRTRLYSNPHTPPRETLERLHLRHDWSAFVPTEGRRDGILSVQIAPLWEGDRLARRQLLVQTRAGLVAAYDADTGQALWRVRVGKPYRANFPLGLNNNLIVAERSTQVFGIDRRTGEVRWRADTNATSATAPLVGENFFYLTPGAKEVAYYRYPAGTGARLTPLLRYPSAVPLQFHPVAMEGLLIYPSPAGSVTIVDKDRPLGMSFRTGGTLMVGPGVHEADGSLYLGSRDTSVYAFKLSTEGEAAAAQPWRFRAGAPVHRTPFVNDEDVYAAAQGRGLFRIRRRTLNGKELADYLVRLAYVSRAQAQEVAAALKERANDPNVLLDELQKKGYLTERQQGQLRWRGGEEIWRQPEADRVLAVSPRFVYAADSSGQLLILDRERGRLLSRCDVRDFVVPVTNELTDRLYLAANNGLLVCLRDRDYATTQEMKQLSRPKGPGQPGKDRQEPAETEGDRKEKEE